MCRIIYKRIHVDVHVDACRYFEAWKKSWKLDTMKTSHYPVVLCQDVVVIHHTYLAVELLDSSVDFPGWEEIHEPLML